MPAAHPRSLWRGRVDRQRGRGNIDRLPVSPSPRLPVSPSRSAGLPTSTLKALKFLIIFSPNESCPTLATIAVRAPSLAAMTHWLAPLPPNPVWVQEDPRRDETSYPRFWLGGGGSVPRRSTGGQRGKREKGSEGLVPRLDTPYACGLEGQALTTKLVPLRVSPGIGRRGT